MTRQQYWKIVNRQAWMCMSVAVCMVIASAAFIGYLAYHSLGR